MTRFITKLVYSGVEGHNRLWITEAPFAFESQIVGLVEIPAGFVFDGNSLPRFMWWLSLPTDYMETGCIHDYLYRFHDNRKECDQVYREMLAYQGANRARRGLRYAALRLFGGKAYAEDHAEVRASGA